MSMLRALDPDSTVKGNSSNYPFWPGGLDMPIEEMVSSGGEVEDNKTGAIIIIYS